MKKLIISLLTILLALGFCACAASPKNAIFTETVTEIPETLAETAAKPEAEPTDPPATDIPESTQTAETEAIPTAPPGAAETEMLPADTEAPTAVPVTEPPEIKPTPDPTAAPEETVAPADEKPSEGWLILTRNGERIMPCIRFLYGTSIVENEDGSLSTLEADGAAFFEGISGAVGHMPEVGPDFEISIAEGCRLQQVKVYDPVSLEQIAFDIAAQELLDVIRMGSSEDMIVEAIVTHTGNYYPAADESERSTYSYAFIVGGSEHAAGESPAESPAE